MSNKSKVVNRTRLDPNIPEELDVIQRIQNLPKMNYEAYAELVKAGQIERFVKFKRPKKIFFDEETGFFCYYNIYYRKLLKCGQWKSE